MICDKSLLMNFLLIGEVNYVYITFTDGMFLLLFFPASLGPSSCSSST